MIRDYKGLDLLLDAWKIYKREHPAEDRRLIVAGEFYAPKEKYLKQIADNGLEDDVILHDYFIPDELVRYYFSVADFLVQPYRSATQSGVTQIAYQFDLPMVVTDVGGLPEIVPDGRVGFVCRPDAAEVARAIDRIWRDDVLAGFRANMEEEKKRFRGMRCAIALHVNVPASMSSCRAVSCRSDTGSPEALYRRACAGWIVPFSCRFVCNTGKTG